MIEKSRDIGTQVSGMHATSTKVFLSEASALAYGCGDASTLLAEHEFGRNLAIYNAYVPAYTGKESFRSTERRRPFFNNCEHNKNTAFSDIVTVAFHNTYARRWYLYRYNRAPFHYTMVPVSKLDRHILVDARNAQATAWGTMQPRFEGDINLLVFLAELKDFKALAKFMLRKPLVKMRNYFRKLGKTAQKLHGPFALTKPLAQLHLTNEFAVKPLISDIFSIVCQMEELARDAQQKFLDAGRERNSRHYTEVLFRDEAATWSLTDQTKNPHIFCGNASTVTFNATMEYSYEYNLRNTLQTFMKYWGLTGSAEAFWELIPFSFLIDYFIKIGNSIRVMSRDKNVTLDLSQYCESYETYKISGKEYKAEHLLGPIIKERSGDQTIGTSTGHRSICGYRSSLYTRRVCEPNRGVALPRLALPTSSQKRNILALARCFL